MNIGCVFCRIASKALPSHVIYEDDKHVAFLDIKPSMKGQTLLVPKKHPGGYLFEMNETDYVDLMLAAKKVAAKLDKALGAKRTCMVVEGFDVSHVHIKLYPIVGMQPLTLSPTHEETPEALKELAEKIRSS